MRAVLLLAAAASAAAVRWPEPSGRSFAHPYRSIKGARSGPLRPLRPLVSHRSVPSS